MLIHLPGLDTLHVLPVGEPSSGGPYRVITLAFSINDVGVNDPARGLMEALEKSANGKLSDFAQDYKAPIPAKIYNEMRLLKTLGSDSTNGGKPNVFGYRRECYGIKIWRIDNEKLTEKQDGSRNPLILTNSQWTKTLCEIKRDVKENGPFERLGKVRKDVEPKKRNLKEVIARAVANANVDPPITEDDVYKYWSAKIAKILEHERFIFLIDPEQAQKELRQPPGGDPERWHWPFPTNCTFAEEPYEEFSECNCTDDEKYAIYEEIVRSKGEEDQVEGHMQDECDREHGG